MNDFFKKIIFSFRKNPVVVIVGREKFFSKNIMSQPLKGKSGALIFTVDFSDHQNLNKLKFFLKNSQKPVLAIAPVGENAEQEISKEKSLLMDQISDLIRSLPAYGYMVASFDHGVVRRIKSESSAHVLTYGLQTGADLLASDINIGQIETNFKANYEGYTIPFWIKNLSQKDDIYLILAVIGIGIVQGFNLVEISQFLKSFDFSFGLN